MRETPQTDREQILEEQVKILKDELRKTRHVMNGLCDWLENAIHQRADALKKCEEVMAKAETV